MAHFAELDENSIVKRVLAVHDNELLDENNVEQEQKGIDFLVNLFGGTWVQTSYSNKFRKCFAGFNYFYDKEQDVFIPPQRYPSWVFNEVVWKWEAPVPYPTEGYYVWNEEIQNWVEPE